MAEPAKRRRRPRTAPATARPRAVEYDTAPVDDSTPAPPEFTLLDPLLGIPGPRVIITRRAFGKTPEEHEVKWPDGWRLPAQGESIHVEGFGGFIEFVDWLPEERTLRVHVR